MKDFVEEWISRFKNVLDQSNTVLSLTFDYLPDEYITSFDDSNLPEEVEIKQEEPLIEKEKKRILERANAEKQEEKEEQEEPKKQRKSKKKVKKVEGEKETIEEEVEEVPKDKELVEIERLRVNYFGANRKEGWPDEFKDNPRALRYFLQPPDPKVDVIYEISDEDLVKAYKKIRKTRGAVFLLRSFRMSTKALITLTAMLQSNKNVFTFSEIAVMMYGPRGMRLRHRVTSVIKNMLVKEILVESNVAMKYKLNRERVYRIETSNKKNWNGTVWVIGDVV